MTIIDRARRVLQIETDALRATADRIDENFVRAIGILLACDGKVVVIGMGKSGLVGAKIAATFASTGTPSFFLHAAEAAHGDLGMVHKSDVALVLSNSGETDEVIVTLPVLRRLGVPIVAMTGVLESRLAQTADAVLDTGVQKEACKLGLAPTASTTAQVAMGDALAVVMLEERGFTEEDFARFHPAGALGKRLLTRVADLMHSGEALPRVRRDTAMTEVLIEMSGKRLGATVVDDEDGKLVGIVTDGDLRRALQKHGALHTLTAGDVVTPHPKAIRAGALATRAAHVMEQNSISVLLVYESGEPERIIGIVHLHDLLKAGII
ncbi:MAG: KpsF/GutQ family sugar-phosphate isomerase [Candidatus Lernaella stagnicola]|nr:KpsF/GutQ family sugar-phosphate isomerase [Candidatus Lernaella stagnicola]